MNFLVATILNKYIGEYVDGLDHLNIDPWGQGTYAVGPLRVKQKILDSLDAPVSIYAAKIDRVFVSIPWLAAFIWAVWPSNKSLIDPIAGNVTGKGYRNSGDTIGSIKYGKERGYFEEKDK